MPSSTLLVSSLEHDGRSSSGSALSSSSASAPSSLTSANGSHDPSMLSAFGSGYASTPTSISWTVRSKPGGWGRGGTGLSAGGELKDQSDEELERFGVGELVRLLRAQWDAGERHAGLIEELNSSASTLQERNAQMAHIINHHVNTEEELEKENTRMEDELMGKIAVVKRLQNRIVELEKDKRETERQHFEQSASFEAERAALWDNEQQLKSRLLTLTRKQAHPSPIRSEPTPLSTIDDDPTELLHHAHERATKLEKELKAEREEKAMLREEVQTLEVGYARLQEALERGSRETGEMKRLNLSLQEEIESYSLLLVERTISGRMGGILSGQTFGDDLRSSSTAFDSTPNSPELQQSRPIFQYTHSASSLHSVVEEDAETLDPALFSREDSEPTSDPMSTLADLELDPSFRSVASDDEAGDAALPTEGTVRRGKRSMRERVDLVLTESGASTKGGEEESLGDYGVSGSGLDLAAELGRAEIDVEEGGLRKLEKGDEGESLRAEIKNLRDANRALTLYTSKILDRILSMDGYEDILSADQGKSLQDSVRRVTAKKSRRNLREVSAHIASQHPSQDILPPIPAPPIPAPPIGGQTVRPGHRSSKSVSAISTSFLTTFSSSPSPNSTSSNLRLSPSALANPLPPSRAPETTTPVAKPKRSRPASIDWKSGFASFFSPSSSPVVPPNSAPTESKLKPFQLSTSLAPNGVTPPPRPAIQRASTFSSSPNPAMSSPVIGRKADFEVEDEEDRLHRERVQLIQAQLTADERGGSRSRRGVRSSSIGLTGTATSPPPLTPGARPAPVDSLADHLEGVEPFFLPQLSSPTGVKAYEITEEMVAAQLASFDAAERDLASRLSTSSGGLSVPSRRTSVSSGHRQSPSSSVKSSPEQDQWLAGDKKTKVEDETLFEYND